MKRLMLLAVFGIFVLNSCYDEESLTSSGTIRFTLGFAGDATTADDLPDAIKVRFSLTSPGGSVTSKEMTFIKSGQGYASEQVTLKAGTYVIKDLFVETDQIEMIDPPLYNFQVTASSSKVNLARASATRAKARHPMHISVYINQNGGAQLTDATAYIYNQAGEYYEYNLSAKKNNIFFYGNPDESYSIEIRKAGYEPYLNTFIYRRLDKKSFNVTLNEIVVEPQLAVTFQPSATYFPMTLVFTGTGSVTIDWGNDETQVISFDPENRTHFVEQAWATTIPPAKITGDIHLITELYFDGAIDALDAEFASSLFTLSLQDADIPVLNLSVNSELRSLNFNNATIGELILPQQHAIRSLTIVPSPFWPNSAQVDYIIENIYVNTVGGTYLNGQVSLNGSPVSTQSAAMLEDLQNSYGWVISY